MRVDASNLLVIVLISSRRVSATVEEGRAAGGEVAPLAESLGGVESLVAHPATMTHASMTPEARRRAGITDSVIRLSIGIEEPEDLIADLDATLGTLPS